MIIKSNFDYIFGAYTSKSFTFEDTYNCDKNAFMFTIYPIKNIYELKDKNSTCAMHSGSSKRTTILRFGIGNDIRLFNNCNIRNRNYCYPYTYNFKDGNIICGAKSSFTDGTFTVKDFEVFSVS